MRKPTEPGFYWLCVDDEITIAKLLANGKVLEVGHSNWLDLSDYVEECEWFGPIKFKGETQ